MWTRCAERLVEEIAQDEPEHPELAGLRVLASRRMEEDR
jgi:hypothetical protein